MAFLETEGLRWGLRMFRGVMRSYLGLGLLVVACSSRNFSHHDSGDSGAPNAGEDGEGARNGNGAGGRGGTTSPAGGTAEQGTSGDSDGAGAPANGTGGSGTAGSGANGAGTTSSGGATSTGGTTNMDGGAANAAGTAMGGHGASAGTVAAGGAGGGTGSGAGAASGGRVGSGGRGTAGDTAIAGAGMGGQPAAVCDGQMLVNADFEAGPGAPWQETSNFGTLEIIVANDDPKLMAQSVSAHGGNYLAWLGGIPSNDFDSYHVDLWQSVTIPTDATSLSLTGAYLVKSDETTADVYDIAYVQLQDDDAVYWVAKILTNEDQGDTWQAIDESTTDLSALRGKTVDFYAYSATDPMKPTSFFLDDLVLTASCGR